MHIHKSKIMEEFQKKIDGLEILLKRQNILNKEILEYQRICDQRLQ